MTGAFGSTVIFMVVLPVPPALVAVMVKVVVSVAVGVPVITPVPVLKLSPAGNTGPIDQLVAAPPVLVGDHELIAVPTVNVFELGV